MQTTLSEPLLLLVVGMITVFTILLLVVLSGKLLIRLVNLWPAHPVQKKTSATPIISQKTGQKPLKSSTIAVISAVTEMMTEGKGKVQKIEKLDKNQ